MLIHVLTEEKKEVPFLYSMVLYKRLHYIQILLTIKRTLKTLLSF
jgi:hypothetical protein